MPTVLKSVIVERSAQAMFDLVDAAEDYPAFLPWCVGVEVLERTQELTRARMYIDFRGLKSQFATVNRKERPEWMHIAFSEGPFQRFQGHWRFTPLGADGCRVEFSLDYAFDSRALEALLGPAFGHIMETLVERFVVRAESAPAPPEPIEP